MAGNVFDQFDVVDGPQAEAVSARNVFDQFDDGMPEHLFYGLKNTKPEPKVVNRGMIVPLSTYDDGTTRFDPEAGIAAPFTAVNRWLSQGAPAGPPSQEQADADMQALGPAALAAIPPTVAIRMRASTPQIQRATEAADDLAATERMNVRPFGPAFGQGPMAATAKQLTEAPFVGAPVRSALEESLISARDATGRVADQFGTTETPEATGRVVQQGLERFKDARPNDVVERQVGGYTPQQRSEIIAAPARDTSLKTKQAALYERAWSYIPEQMREGRSVEGQARVMGNPTNTRAILQELTQRNLQMVNQARAGREGGQAVAYPVQGGLIGRVIRDIVESPRQTMSLQTMRNLRSELRRLSSGMADTEKNTLKLSDIERLQSAVTNDMVALLARNADDYARAGDIETANGFQRAIREFRRADTFTRLSAERLEHIEKMFNAPNAEALYRSVAQSALNKGRGDLDRIRILRRTLRDDEMREVASGVIRQLGEPIGSARGVTQEIGFSVSSFMTRWQNMTPEARAVLFGHEHARALDDLTRTINRLANVEALANTSRSTSNAMGIGGLIAAGGSYAAGGLDWALGGLAASGLASILFSRPEYARWAVRYAQLRANAGRGQTAQQLARHVHALRLMAANDNALLPAYRAVSGEREEEPQQPEFRPQ